jgi:glycerol-3-phosphate O-acyltransferase
VALVLLGQGRRGINYRDLFDQCLRTGELMRQGGARIAPSLLPKGARELRGQGVVEALHLYVKGGLVEQHLPGEMHAERRSEGLLRGLSHRGDRLHIDSDLIFTVPDNKRVRLDFAKNHIIHFLVDRALIATALLCRAEEEELTRAVVGARVQSLSRLFKYEFMFRADAPFERIFDESLGTMTAAGEIAREGEELAPGPGHDGLDGRGWLGCHAAVLRNFIEGYAVAARTLEHLLKGGMPKKELIKLGLKNGQRMFLRAEIERSEAVARPIFEHAFDAFVDQGYLLRKGDELSLAQSFYSAAGVQAVEARITAFLP